MNRCNFGTVMRLNTKVLFISTTSRESEAFVPLIRELDKRECKCIVITFDELYNDNASPVLLNLGISFIPFGKFKTYNAVEILYKIRPNILIVGSDFTSTGRGFIKGAQFLQIHTVLIFPGNITSTEITLKYRFRLLNKVFRDFSFHFKNYFVFLSTSRFLNKWKDLIITPINHVLNFILKYDLRGQGRCDLILVPGYYQKFILVTERNVCPDKIKIVGDAKYDDIYTTTPRKEVILKEYQCKPEAKIIVIGTISGVEHGFWTENQRKRFFRETVDSILKLEAEIYVLVRIHPLEKKETYQRYIKSKEQEIVHIVDSISTRDLIKVCDVFISVMSTVIHESILLRKPTIFYNPFNKADSSSYVRHRGAVGIYNKEDLECFLKQFFQKGKNITKMGLLNPIDTNRFIKYHQYKVDGKSAKRSVDAILSLDKG